MFESEEKMISHLIEQMNNEHVYKEIGSGYGIADLVLVKNRAEFNRFLNKRQGRYLQSNDQIKIFMYLRRKRKGVSFKRIYNDHYISKIKLKYKILKHLIEIEAITFENGLYYRNPEFNLFSIDCEAIEGKLSNWNAGLFQAIRYKRFARKSFVAIDERYLHRIDKEVFQEQNIGLISVGSKMKIQYIPIKEIPLDPVMRYRISENIIKKIYN